MISVEAALEALLALVEPLGEASVPLTEAAGRVLASPAVATRSQPPFASSAMDGYAVQSADAAIGKTLAVIGEAAAGHRYAGKLSKGQAVRIFTGAPMPDGADYVVIQEDVSRDGDQITISETLGSGSNVRAAASDFKIGDTMSAPRRLVPSDVALLAAMNVTPVQVTNKPVVAVIATGDELVTPGETPNEDQIIASNSYGLKAMLEAEGAHVRLLPIARDTPEALALVFKLAATADLIVTIGGASVGDHDLVGEVAQSLGLDRAFYKIAMRPGKPLMAGQMGDAVMVGLPGNPVSAMVCGHIFLRPMIRAMLGLEARTEPQTARLAAPLPANGPRAHYMRARVEGHEIKAFERQDSALLTVLAEANALLIHPEDDAAREMGDEVSYLRL